MQKNEAREKAAVLGATHIVWKSVSGSFSPIVVHHIAL
jgi:hypothetical protein